MGQSRYSLRGPNKGIVDILYFRVRELMNSNYNNSLELMLRKHG